jgi:hypothetical protein
MITIVQTICVRHQNIWDARVYFVTKDLAHLSLMLSRFALMVQAAFLDGQFLDLFPPSDDRSITPEVGTWEQDIVETLMVAVIIAMIDKVSDVHLEITR